ncbi:MAG: hypothetical protein JRJ02_06705 [Deltaproteobacteria bacterium]|nr:hypothetical protein [Deltaproteobacteria bacterium]
MLTAFLRREGVDAVHADLSLALFLRLFSRPGLQEMVRLIRRSRRRRNPSVHRFLENAGHYLETIDEVIRIDKNSLFDGLSIGMILLCVNNNHLYQHNMLRLISVYILSTLLAKVLNMSPL